MESRPDRPMIGMVVLQPTPFCNINCSYCYLPERSDKTLMADATLKAAFERVFDSGWTSDDLSIIWHAGEPLVAPPGFYERAFQAIEKLRPRSVRVRHSMQTNGMLISHDWCELFKSWRVGVGVSIDGPKQFNDAHRVTRSGKSTFEQTLAGIRLLREEGVPFHVISVLSQRSMDAAEEMLAFYESEGIEDICFNVEESEGTHVSELFSGDRLQVRFGHFLGTFWRLARAGRRIRFIREIDGMLPRVFRPDSASVRNIQVEPFGMVNIDCKGNVSTFSPELLGLKSTEYHDFIIGNVHASSLEEMRGSEAMRAMARDIASGVETCRRNCEYFSVCGGGAPVNKLFENGSFGSGRTSFCDLTQKVPIDLILDAFGQLQGGLAEEDPSNLARRALDRANGIGMAMGS
jgi:uncharacterized protein